MLPLQQTNRGPVPPCIHGVPVFFPRPCPSIILSPPLGQPHPPAWKEMAQIESKIWSNVLTCLNFRLHSIWINQNKGLCFGWPSSDVQCEAERRSPAGVKSQSKDESPGWNCQVKKKSHSVTICLIRHLNLADSGCPVNWSLEEQMGEVRGAVETSGSLHSCLVKPSQVWKWFKPSGTLVPFEGFRNKGFELPCL